MLPEIELDALHCLDGMTLDGLQMHSRYLRDIVDHHGPYLPVGDVLGERVSREGGVRDAVRARSFARPCHALGLQGECNLRLLSVVNRARAAWLSYAKF